VVVDGEDGVALEGAHGAGDALVFAERERGAVALGLPVGRVEVEQGVGTVVAVDAVVPGEVLDDDLGQTQVGGTQLVFDAQQVQARAGAAGDHAE